MQGSTEPARCAPLLALVRFRQPLGGRSGASWHHQACRALSDGLVREAVLEPQRSTCSCRCGLGLNRVLARATHSKNEERGSLLPAALWLLLLPRPRRPSPSITSRYAGHRIPRTSRRELSPTHAHRGAAAPETSWVAGRGRLLRARAAGQAISSSSAGRWILRRDRPPGGGPRVRHRALSPRTIISGSATGPLGKRGPVRQLGPPGCTCSLSRSGWPSHSLCSGSSPRLLGARRPFTKRRTESDPFLARSPLRRAHALPRGRSRARPAALLTRHPDTALADGRRSRGRSAWRGGALPPARAETRKSVRLVHAVPPRWRPGSRFSAASPFCLFGGRALVWSVASIVAVGVALRFSRFGGPGYQELG